MKLKYIGLAAITSLLIFISSYYFHSPEPILAQSSRLTREQLQQLKALPIKTLLPGYVPQGFEIIDVKLEEDRATGYTVLYEKENTCFLIEALNKGIGGSLDLESMQPIKSKIFGGSYFLNYGSPKDADVKKEFPEPDLYSDWMKYENAYYRLTGSLLAREQYDYANCRQDLSPAEALKVIESLAPINNPKKENRKNDKTKLIQYNNIQFANTIPNTNIKIENIKKISPNPAPPPSTRFFFIYPDNDENELSSLEVYPLTDFTVDLKQIDEMISTIAVKS